ncbi:MAG: glycosyltransferase family 87 protein [Anaerolineales bacterium]
MRHTRVGWFGIGVGLVIISALLLSIYWVIYQNFTTNSTDFVPRWEGTRAFFQEGISPYDPVVGERSQRVIYGRLAEPDEDQVLFAYPFYTIFHVGLLAWLDYPVAAALYMELLLLGVLGAMALVLHTIRWLPPPRVFGLYLLWTLISYFTVRGVLLAQPALMVYLFHTLAIWAIFRERDTLAGVALGLATLKPQTGFLLVPLLLIWAWRMGRWRIVLGFGGMFGTLMGLSFLLEPTWMSSWLTQVSDYRGYTETVPPMQRIADAIPLLPTTFTDAVYYGASVILLGIVLALWWRVLRQRQNDELLWVIYFTMNITLLISPSVATTFYVELFPVLYITGYLLVQQKQSALLFIVTPILLFGYWILHVVTLPPAGPAGAGLEAPIVYIIFPLLTLGLLFGGRRAWPRVPQISA